MKDLRDTVEFIKEGNLNIVTMPEFIFDDETVYEELLTIINELNKLISINILTPRQLFKIKVNYDKLKNEMIVYLNELEQTELIIYLDMKLYCSKKEALELELYETVCNIKNFQEFDYKNYFLTTK